jgi:hypothetical protein
MISAFLAFSNLEGSRRQWSSLPLQGQALGKKPAWTAESLRPDRAYWSSQKESIESKDQSNCMQ